jgi:hypothetical protein
MEINRRPKRRDLVLFVLLHLAIVTVCGVAIWQMVGGVIGPAIEGTMTEVAARLPMVAGLLVVLAVLAASARRP